MSLRCALDLASAPLARAAAAFAEKEVWIQFGYARIEDHARERFCRSGRWVRDLAALGRLFSEHPGLEAAVCGTDGSAPIGRVAGLLIGRVASAESLREWVALARSSSVRELREAVATAREAGSAWPRESSDASAGHVIAGDVTGSDVARVDAGAGKAAGDDVAAGDADAGKVAAGHVALVDPVTSDADADEVAEGHVVAGDGDARKVAAGDAGVGEVARGDVASGDGDARKIAAGEAAGDHVASGDADAGEVAGGRVALGDDQDDDDATRSLVRLELPSPALAAFDEAVDLFRALEGREASVTAFVEALVAEAASSTPPPASFDGAHHEELTRGETIALRERALARSTNTWEHLSAPGGPAQEGPEWALRLAGLTLARLRAISPEAGRGTPRDLDEQIRELAALEDEIERRLAALLAQMGDNGAWERLRFDSAVHYAEQRLGLGRTATRMRMRVVRALRRLPETRRAYEAGAVGTEAAWLISKMIGRLDVGRQVELEWIERARLATVKRLRDEARLAGRRAAGLDEAIARERPEVGSPGGLGSPPGADGPDGYSRVIGQVRPPGMETGNPEGPSMATSPDGTRGIRLQCRVHSPIMETPNPEGSWFVTAPDCSKRPLPVTDEAWHASLRRVVGTARSRIVRLGRMAASRRVSDVFLRLRLPTELGLDFLGAIEAARRRLELRAGEVPWEEPWPDPDPPGSILAAREAFVRCRRTPAWVGLLVLLEDFVETWDVDHARSRRAGQAIHERSGWRCSAPGCTSRMNLENHHIAYSGRGGSDEHWNRLSLCRFHHQCGEHGGLARVRGRAPLGLHWRLGRGGCGGSYRNEIRADTAGRRATTCGDVNTVTPGASPPAPEAATTRGSTARTQEEIPTIDEGESTM